VTGRGSAGDRSRTLRPEEIVIWTLESTCVNQRTGERETQLFDLRPSHYEDTWWWELVLINPDSGQRIRLVPYGYSSSLGG
jgi:hypothetical protein